MQFDWTYYALTQDGRLVDNETGEDINPNWPSFETDEEAEEWLVKHDIRGNVC